MGTTTSSRPDYESLVRSVYPEAWLSRRYIGWAVWADWNPDSMICRGTATAIDLAWQKTWESIERRMMERLSQ
jgi:hypothetical protein